MNKLGLSLGCMTLVILTLLSPAAAEILRLDYEGFTIWLDVDWEVMQRRSGNGGVNWAPSVRITSSPGSSAGASIR